MKFKLAKRALIICAALVTLAPISAEEFKNSVVNVKLNKDVSGNIKVNLVTAKPYSNRVFVNKKSDTQYVILLPETKNSMEGKPLIDNLSGSVSGISIKTQPYVAGGCKGYTKIIINTNKSINISAVTSVQANSDASVIAIKRPPVDLRVVTLNGIEDAEITKIASEPLEKVIQHEQETSDTKTSNKSANNKKTVKIVTKKNNGSVKTIIKDSDSDNSVSKNDNIKTQADLNSSKVSAPKTIKRHTKQHVQTEIPQPDLLIKAQQELIAEEIEQVKEEKPSSIKIPEVHRDKLKVKLPKLHMPEVNLSEIQKPELKLPKLSKPSIKIPKPKKPHVKLPEISKPSINLPKPKKPQVKLPRVSKPSISVPRPKKPQVHIPEITIPQVSVPKLKLPKVELPNYQLPDLRELLQLRLDMLKLLMILSAVGFPIIAIFFIVFLNRRIQEKMLHTSTLQANESGLGPVVSTEETIFEQSPEISFAELIDSSESETSEAIVEEPLSESSIIEQVDEEHVIESELPEDAVNEIDVSSYDEYEKPYFEPSFADVVQEADESIFEPTITPIEPITEIDEYEEELEPVEEVEEIYEVEEDEEEFEPVEEVEEIYEVEEDEEEFEPVEEVEEIYEVEEDEEELEPVEEVEEIYEVEEDEEELEPVEEVEEIYEVEEVEEEFEPVEEVESDIEYSLDEEIENIEKVLNNTDEEVILDELVEYEPDGSLISNDLADDISIDIFDEFAKISDIEENIAINEDIADTVNAFADFESDYYEPDGYISSYENDDDSVFDELISSFEMEDKVISEQEEKPVEAEVIEEEERTEYETTVDGLTVLNQTTLNEISGFYLVNFENFTSLIGYIKDEVFVLKTFDEFVNNHIYVKLAEKVKESKLRYIVRVDSYKMIIEVTDSVMSHMIDL